MIKKLVAIAIAFIAIGLPCVARADGPASRPAADADAPVARKSKVMIERIEVIGPAGSDWIGRAVEQGITAGISQESSHKFTAKGERVGRIATLDDLQKAGVDFLVRGVCQVADDQIRIDGSVSRVGTDINDGIGTFRIEGNTRDLFSTEDALSEKIVKMMAAANDAKNKDASPANHPATQPAAAATPVTLPDLGSNRFSGVDVPRYFDGDLSEILNPPARFQDEAHRYFNGQPVYPFSYPCYVYSPFVGGGYFGGFIGGSFGNFEPTFGPD
jgi:TolB-like protein